MNNTIENQEQLLDQFAGLALEALISKMPFYDAKGEYGEHVSQDELTEIKKGITKTAYEYASYMLIARKEQGEWLNENKDYFQSQVTTDLPKSISLKECPFLYCDSKPVCENKCRYDK